MSETLLDRMADLEPELVEGGSSEFDESDYTDGPDDDEGDEEDETAIL